MSTVTGNPKTITVKDVLALKQKFITTINSYRIKSYDTQDILQEYYSRIFAISPKDLRNYVQRYDGSSTIATWLYGPLKNLCYSIKTRENTKGGLAISNAIKITQTKEDDSDEPSLSSSVIPAVDLSAEDTVEAAQIMEIIERDYSGFNSKSSTGIERSPAKVIELIMQGYTKAEIAEKMEVSQTFINFLVKKLRKDVNLLKIYLDFQK